MFQNYGLRLWPMVIVPGYRLRRQIAGNRLSRRFPAINLLRRFSFLAFPMFATTDCTRLKVWIWWPIESFCTCVHMSTASSLDTQLAASACTVSCWVWCWFKHVGCWALSVAPNCIQVCVLWTVYALQTVVYNLPGQQVISNCWSTCVALLAACSQYLRFPKGVLKGLSCTWSQTACLTAQARLYIHIIIADAVCLSCVDIFVAQACTCCCCIWILRLVLCILKRLSSLQASHFPTSLTKRLAVSHG